MAMPGWTLVWLAILAPGGWGPGGPLPPPHPMCEAHKHQVLGPWRSNQGEAASCSLLGASWGGGWVPAQPTPLASGVGPSP